MKLYNGSQHNIRALQGRANKFHYFVDVTLKFHYFVDVTQTGDRGWKEAQRQGEDRVTLAKALITNVIRCGALKAAEYVFCTREGLPSMKYRKSLGLPIVGSVLFGCGLLFGLWSFLFFLWFTCWVFFLYLFIYLFIYLLLLFSLNWWKHLLLSGDWGGAFSFSQKEPLSTSYLKCLCVGLGFRAGPFSPPRWESQGKHPPPEAFRFSKLLLAPNAQLWHIRHPPFTLWQSAKGLGVWRVFLFCHRKYLV